MADLIVHVIPERDPVNLYYPASRLVISGSRTIYDTRDLAAALNSMVMRSLEFHPAAMAPRWRPPHRVHNIARLIITGHGNPTGFYIGSDWVTNEVLTDRNNQVTRELTQIRGLFTSNATVVLRACNTGQSLPIMRSLSSVLGGVTVQGSEDRQFGLISGLRGNAVECRLDMCRSSR